VIFRLQQTFRLDGDLLRRNVPLMCVPVVAMFYFRDIDGRNSQARSALPLGMPLARPIREEEPMAGKNTAVFGIYSTGEQVEEAIRALRDNNFRTEDISILFSENEGSKDFAHVKSTKAPEGASAGAAGGAVIGGVLGWLAGIGAIAIPGVGPFIAAGPIMAALAGAGVGGTVGGVTGSLVGMGMPEYEAKRYEGRVRKGGYLLSVHCDNSDWVQKAKDILLRTGAEDVSSSGEAAADFARADKPLSRGARDVAN
jgi:heat induced stress protein YflT/ActD protein